MAIHAENYPLSWFERSSFETIRRNALPGDPTCHAFLLRHCRLHGIPVSGSESSIDMACLLMRRAATEADLEVIMQASEEEFDMTQPPPEQSAGGCSSPTRDEVAISPRMKVLNSRIQLCEGIRSAEVASAQSKMEIQVGPS